jgi:hypothetical protein
MRSDNYIQIDVMNISEKIAIVECNMYTPEGCVKIAMSRTDYDQLQRNGFFIRPGTTADSAGVFNTTIPYYPFKP